MISTSLKFRIIFYISLIFLSGCINKSSNQKIQLEKHNGFCWEAGMKITNDTSYYSILNDYNVNWISQTPFIWQNEYNQPSMSIDTIKHKIMWGETEKGISTTASYAKSFGIKTMLKPHIWLTNSKGFWRSDIIMQTKEDFDKWFLNYKKSILYFAILAEKNKIEAFCIGTELRATISHTEKWRDIIRAIRSVYSGKLIYAANWYKEYEEIEFWDDLDFIGIQAYFPLSKKRNPTLEDLNKGWLSHIKSIEKIYYKFKKPVIFTEIGYKNSNDTTEEPWKWPKFPRVVKTVDGYSLLSKKDTVKYILDSLGYPIKQERELKPAPDINNELQTLAFEAFFQSVWKKQWFAGAYIWKWRPTKKINYRLRKNVNFSPKSEKTMNLIKQWYGK